MNSVERVLELCKERKVSVAKLERELGFGNGYIRGLKKGVIQLDRLSKIADYFNVSVNYLSGIDEMPDFNQAFTEKKALTGYLKSIGWNIERTDLAKGKPCTICIENQTSNPTEDEPFGSGKPLCAHCLMKENYYVFSNGSITVNVDDEEFNALISDVRDLCMDKIKEFINKSLFMDVYAAHPTTNPDAGDSDTIENDRADMNKEWD